MAQDAADEAAPAFQQSLVALQRQASVHEQLHLQYRTYVSRPYPAVTPALTSALDAERRGSKLTTHGARERGIRVVQQATAAVQGVVSVRRGNGVCCSRTT